VTRPRTVVIVGGGISGLATAFALLERASTAGLSLRCTILEAGSSWGGKIVTHRIGDIVTVKIVESSSATNQANTVTERDSSLTASIDAFLGLEQKFLNPAHPDYRAGRNFNPFGAIKGGMASEFDGSGTTSRSGDLTVFCRLELTENLTNLLERQPEARKGDG